MHVILKNSYIFVAENEGVLKGWD